MERKFIMLMFLGEVHQDEKHDPCQVWISLIDCRHQCIYTSNMANERCPTDHWGDRINCHQDTPHPTRRHYEDRMHISANFDSGNIDVLSASDPSAIRLAIRPDVGGEHMQWFYFRVSGARDRDLVLRLTNAAKASYPHAWKGYSACTSSDRATWTRVPTDYKDGELVIRHRPTGDLQWYAYFAPFSLEQHHALLARCQASALARVDRLGATVDGRDLDRVTVGYLGKCL
jgi:hypothetical protein